MQPKTATLAMLALVSLQCAAAFAQDGPVWPKEIQDTWVGKDLIGTNATGTSALMRLEPDGRASVSVGSTSDTGTWRLSESGYCTTWKNIRAGQERCFTVARSGSAYRVTNPDGSLSGIFTGIR